VVPERFGTRSKHRRRPQENPGWEYPTSQLTVWFGKRRSAGSGADSGQNEISCCVNLKIWLLVKAYSWLNASSLARQVVHHCSLAAVRYTYLNLVTAYVFSSICWIGFDRRRQFLHRTEECCIWCSEHCILRFQAPCYGHFCSHGYTVYWHLAHFGWEGRRWCAIQIYTLTVTLKLDPLCVLFLHAF